MIALCKTTGLKEPEFMQEDVFKTAIWRVEDVTGQVSKAITRLVLVISGEAKRIGVQDALVLKQQKLINYRLTIFSSVKLKARWKRRQ